MTTDLRRAAVSGAPPPEAAARRAHRRPGRLAVAGVALTLAVAAALGVRHVTGDTARAASDDAARAVPASWQRTPVDADQLARTVGVELVRVSVTGGGGLLDLRFRVVDPEAAASVHDQKTPPAVVDEDSGLVVNDLLMGHSHTAPFKAGVTYYLIFENAPGWVHRGSKVSVLLGDAQVEHVTVS